MCIFDLPWRSCGEVEMKEMLIEKEVNKGVGGHKFRVHLPLTPKWKIEAIARSVELVSYHRILHFVNTFCPVLHVFILSVVRRFKSHQSRKRKYTPSALFTSSSPAINQDQIIEKQMKLDEIHFKCCVRASPLSRYQLFLFL
jgi:hypothetical protein